MPAEDPLPSILVNGSDASLPSTELLRLQHESGVDAVLLNGFGDYDDVHKVLQANESFAIGVAGYQDVIDARRAGKLAVILGWQSADKLSVGAGVDWGFHGLPQLDLDKQRAELALYTSDGEARHVSSGERENELRRMRGGDAAAMTPVPGNPRRARISAKSRTNGGKEPRRGP